MRVYSDILPMVCRALKVFLFGSFFTLFVSCSVAVPDVTSLLSNLGLFKLNQNELRIQSLSELSSVTISAQCSQISTGFEFEFSNVMPETWVLAPTSASGNFVSVNEQCATANTVSFVLDLSTLPPFSSMTLGSVLQIKIRDMNDLGLPTTETFKIIYSNYNLLAQKQILGHGVNKTLSSNSFSLKGRLIERSETVSTSGSYSLQGKVIFR